MKAVEFVAEAVSAAQQAAIAINKKKHHKPPKSVAEDSRVARKPRQPANSKKHSDLYTDENPKGTITGLKFATAEDARASVSKIRASGRSHAHKIQAAVAMEQRARVMGKSKAAAVYRRYINSVKQTKESVAESKRVTALEKSLTNPHSYDAIDHMMQSIAKQNNISAKELHDEFVETHGMTPDEWIRSQNKDMTESALAEACWKGYRKDGMKTMFGKRYPNCVKKKKKTESVIEPDPETEAVLEQLAEDLRKWFKQKWVRFGPDGKIRGDCAREKSSEGKPKCLPQAKAQALGKKGRAKAGARKRRQDPDANRSGKAINVKTK